MFEVRKKTDIIRKRFLKPAGFSKVLKKTYNSIKENKI